MGNVLFGFVAGLYVQDLLISSGGSILGIGSGIVLGLFMALGAFVRLLFSPIAGVLVDRWNKVKIIYLTDYFRGIIFLISAYVFFIGVSNDSAVIILLSITVISGIISAFFGPAISSATPEIVGMDKLQQANGTNSLISSSTMIMGVILGAAAFGLFSFHIALLLNGISFIISGFSEMFIKSEFKMEIQPDEHLNMLKDIKIGFNYIVKRNGLLTLLVYSLFLNLAFSPLFSVGIPYLFRTELSKGPWDLAWIDIAFGVSMTIAGIVVGGMKFKSMTKVIRKGLLFLFLSFLLSSTTIYLLSSGQISYSVFYIILIVANISMAVFMMGVNIPLNTSMVKVIAPEIRGRVLSTVSAISGGAVPIAIFLGGVIINLSSVAFLGIVCSALLIVPMLGFMFDKRVKDLLDGMDDEVNEQVQVVS